MPATHLTVTEAVRRFFHYLDRVTQCRESFLLSRRGKVIAELRPAASGTRLGDLPSILAGLPRLSKSEAEAFARDIREARCSLDPRR